MTEKREFETGSVRDKRGNKGRYDLIPPLALHRLAQLFQEGGEHYGDRNWEKGQPVCASFLDSARRHINQAIAGMEDEDHMIRAAWNCLCASEIMHRIKMGDLPKQLDDRLDLSYPEAIFKNDD